MSMIILAALAGTGIGGGLMYFYNNKIKRKTEVILDEDEEILD